MLLLPGADLTPPVVAVLSASPGRVLLASVVLSLPLPATTRQNLTSTVCHSVTGHVQGAFDTGHVIILPTYLNPAI